MRVAWLCPYPVTTLPGAPLGRTIHRGHPCTWILTQSRALRRSYPEIELQLITASPWVTRNWRTEVDGITVHVERCGAVPGSCRGWPAWLPWDVWTDFRGEIRRLAARVQSIQPDLVHAHGTERAYGLAALATNRPNVISLQGILNEIYRDHPGSRFARLRELELDCVKRGRFFIAKSPFARAFVERTNPAATIFDVENPMPDAFHAAKAQPGRGQRIVFVGSLVPEKGVGELLEAVKRVPQAQLALIGAGSPDYVRTLEDTVRGQGLAGRVQFRGAMGQAQVIETLVDSDLLVLPSHMETSPNVIAEAMCLGLPVLATRVGGIPSMVRDGVTGRLVPVKDAAALGDSLRELLADSARLARMGAAARDEAHIRFSSETSARRLFEAYQQIVRR